MQQEKLVCRSMPDHRSISRNGSPQTQQKGHLSVAAPSASAGGELRGKVGGEIDDPDWANDPLPMFQLPDASFSRCRPLDGFKVENGFPAQCIVRLLRA